MTKAVVMLGTSNSKSRKKEFAGWPDNARDDPVDLELDKLEGSRGHLVLCLDEVIVDLAGPDDPCFLRALTLS